jgi:hypothetical protein
MRGNKFCKRLTCMADPFPSRHLISLGFRVTENASRALYDARMNLERAARVQARFVTATPYSTSGKLYAPRVIQTSIRIFSVCTPGTSKSCGAFLSRCLAIDETASPGQRPKLRSTGFGARGGRLLLLSFPVGISACLGAAVPGHSIMLPYQES